MCINQWMLSFSKETRATVAPHSAWLSFCVCEHRCARESARGGDWQGYLFLSFWECAAAQEMVLARSSPASASHPRSGDRILIFKPEWLRLVLSGHKTLEVRAAAYKAGKYYFGTGGTIIENMSEHRLVWVGGGARGVIYCQAYLGHPFRVECLRHFKRHRGQHRVITDRLPYKTTYCLPILNVKKIKVPFVHPPGAITIVKYVPPA